MSVQGPTGGPRLKPSRPAFIYRIETFGEYGIDRNNNGRLSAGDDQVVKLGFNPATGKYDRELQRRFLNPAVQQKITQAIAQNPAHMPVRVVYQRMPENPPPVVFKDETDLGQHIKAGAGHAIGGMAVEAVGGLLGALFSSDGGASKKRKK